MGKRLASLNQLSNQETVGQVTPSYTIALIGRGCLPWNDRAKMKGIAEKLGEVRSIYSQDKLTAVGANLFELTW